MTECPECGGPLAGDEETCPACGASIEGAVPAAVPAAVPEPAPDEPEADAEAVPSVEPQAETSDQERVCPECGAVNPAEARFCIRCRHAFAGRTPFLGAGWLVVPALIAVILIVAVVAALSFGFVSVGPKENPAAKNLSARNTSAVSGANGTVQQVLNLTRNATQSNASALAGAGNATLNATPTRTVDPNATIWNAQIGSGIYHTAGGTHFVEDSNEIQALKRAAIPPTPTVPYSAGDGSGHATGPLSWVGTGNWSPGFIDLPAGDAKVVLLSQGTTAFILADPNGERVGFGAFPPPGGQFTVPIEQAGKFVIAFGTANATDSWSATLLLPGATPTVIPPVATPATQVFTYAGTSGGSPGSFNLTPGTVQVQLYAEQLTMAYLKGPWGETLSTTVAGPNAGGSTVAITQNGTYRLDIWGPGTWSAVVTWTAPRGATVVTIPTMQPVTTLTPWNVTATTAPPANTTMPATTLATVATTVT